MVIEKIEFEIVSLESILISEMVDMVVIPGSEGDFGVLSQHAPMITTIRHGIIDIYNDGKVEERISVTDGFVEVNETRITVLVEKAINISKLDQEAIVEQIKVTELHNDDIQQ
ncbi:MAG: ATP synthase F1 subunit epsilon [Rhodospirillaceae bacterium]|jgi:F-type H+-transporting ATPase subunit epsilon|nr:ATP synthase F1 subunit epsilon [Rhodospirillaceae bacterium]